MEIMCADCDRVVEQGVILEPCDRSSDRGCAELPVTAVDDMPWNMHEFTLTDPSGNHIRIGKPTAD
jgi:hypothetical protein